MVPLGLPFARLVQRNRKGHGIAPCGRQKKRHVLLLPAGLTNLKSVICMNHFSSDFDIWFQINRELHQDLEPDVMELIYSLNSKHQELFNLPGRFVNLARSPERRDGT